MSPCSQAAPLSKHLGEPTNLGGSRSQGCHGYLLAVPVVLRPPHRPVRHQFPSSSFGDEFNFKRHYFELTSHKNAVNKAKKIYDGKTWLTH